MQQRQIHPKCEEIEPIRLSLGYFVGKRLFDLVGTFLLLIAFLPLLIVISILVKLNSPGPLIYKSTRVGRGGRLFTFLKFRSMVSDADKQLEQLKDRNEKEGPIFKIREDPRLTSVGRFLRRYSLDELPQLWNVIKGEMSLVGPRPMLPREVDQYRPEDFERLRVKPGITCYWQVMGRSQLTFDEWMELDRKYVREMSVLTDMKILGKTTSAVLKGDGAY